MNDPDGCISQVAKISGQVQLMESLSVSSYARQFDDRANINTSLSLTPDEDKAIRKFLESQQEGLEKLVDIMKKDSNDLTLMKQYLTTN